MHTATIITFFLTENYGGIETVIVLDSNTSILCFIFYF